MINVQSITNVVDLGIKIFYLILLVVFIMFTIGIIQNCMTNNADVHKCKECLKIFPCKSKGKKKKKYASNIHEFRRKEVMIGKMPLEFTETTPNDCCMHRCGSENYRFCSFDCYHKFVSTYNTNLNK